MVRKFQHLHAARGIFSILIVVVTAHQLGIAYWKFHLLPGLGDQIRLGALDFYFMLSGFVLFAIYHSHIGDRRVGGQFLFKRLVRLYPVYWYILIAIIPFSSFFTGRRNTDFGGIVQSIFLVPHDGSLLPTSWSLSHLLLFYTFFAILLFLGRSAGTLFVSLWFLGIVINFTQGLFQHHRLLDFLFSKYHLYFFAGGFIAYLTKKIRFAYPGWLAAAGAAGLMLAVLNVKHGWVPLDDVYNYGIPATLLVCGLASLDCRKDIRLPKFLNFLGQASYSLYLAHYPALVVLYHLATAKGLVQNADPAVLSAGMIVAALLIGWLSHVLIEKPLLSFIFFRRNIQVSSDSYMVSRG
jgi:exopolysaccharide production protein ExoZ